MYLKLDSNFRPFTYDELIKPVVAYKQEYDKIDEDFSNLMTQAEAWKDIATQTNNPEAYAMYERFSTDLNNAVSDFSNGTRIGASKNALRGMKKRYAQEIVPIANADAAMKAANEFRAKAGPDAIFEVDDYNSIDYFLHGNTANNRYQSKSELTKKTATMTEAAMAQAIQDPDFIEAMGDKFIMITQHTGGSNADLEQALKLGMADNPIAQNIFSQIRQRVLQESGYENYGERGRKAITEAIDMGLYSGLDKPVRNFQANPDHITPVQQHSMNNADKQLALNAALHNIAWDSKTNSWIPRESTNSSNTTIKKSDLVPEYIAGRFTGRYYHPGTKKFYDKDENLASQEKIEYQDLIITPLFFDAFSQGASKGYQLKSTNDQNKNDIQRINYDDIRGKEAKQAIKDYIYYALNIEEDKTLADDTLEQIIPYLEITRDWDFGSDNHYAVRLPGVDDEGHIIDKVTFLNAMTKINSKLKEDPAFKNMLPKR